jgi:Undecaprenyl-phosphate galactose phosphotransferase WbaP
MRDRWAGKPAARNWMIPCAICAEETPMTQHPAGEADHTLSLPLSSPEVATGLRARQMICKYSLVTADLAALIVAGALANILHWVYLGAPVDEFLRIWSGSRGEVRLSLFSALLGIGIASFWVLGHYTRRRPAWDEISDIIRVLAILAVLDASLLYLAKLQFSRFWFVSTWVIGIALIPITRVLVKRALATAGFWQRDAVVFGTGPNAVEAVEALESEPSMGFRVIGFMQPPNALQPVPPQIEASGKLFPVIYLGRDPGPTLEQLEKPTIVVALEQENLSRDANIITRMHRYCDDLRVVPPMRGLPLFGATVHHFFRHELFFLTLRNNLARRGPRLLKRLFDVAVASLLLVLLSPMFLYFAIAIKRDGGSVFFGHQRIGRDGIPFRCLKFRTMVPDAPAVLQRLLDTDPAARAEWEQDFKLKNDPRITKIGKFLREYSLDEFAQLWNVLRGDMSLVGPRPIVAAELERYADNADFYLEAKPGMTGLWQISGRNNTDYSYRIYLDSWYVKNWSLWYDIVILIKTVRVVALKEGAY